MQLKKKLKICLIYLILISFVVPAAAKEQVLRVKKGMPAPYTGWCLTEEAMAIIIADKEQSTQRCQLRLDEYQDKINARYKLDIGNLKVKISAIEQEYTAILSIKNAEIVKLEKIALDRPNEYWYLFLSGGFLAGVLGTVGVVYMVK
jgi:hypothetical protein